MKADRRGVDYWNKRFDLIYYQYVYYVCRVVGKDATSTLDVGSRGTPFLEWLTWIDERVSVDIQVPYASPRVVGIKADFFEFKPEKKFDLTTCLQVMEHVPDAARFGKKLLEVSNHLVVSVPFEWIGKTPGHVNDPVTLKKLAGWMGREPNYHIIAAEPFVGRNGKRLIAYYDVNDPKRQMGVPDRASRRPSEFVPPGSA